MTVGVIVIDEQCLDYVKTFYFPGEAAAAWCGISDQEYNILIKDINLPTFEETFGYGNFLLMPDKPCFKKRLEQICYAIDEDHILCSRDGKPDNSISQTNEGITRKRRAFTALELKKWMEKTHPNERPPFIFNQLERKELKDAQALYEQVVELQNINDHLNSRLNHATEIYKEMKRDGRETIQEKREKLFKFWLIGKGYKHHHQETSKHHIDDLTRNEVWEILHEINPSTFNANINDFFKNQQLARFLE